MTCKVFGSGDSLPPWAHWGRVCSLEPGPCPEVGHNAVQSDANEAHKEKGTNIVRAISIRFLFLRWVDAGARRVSCFSGSGSVILTVQDGSIQILLCF